MLGCDSIETKIAIPKHQRQKNLPRPTLNPFASTFVPSAPMQHFVPRQATIRHEPGTSVYVRGLADDVDNDKLRVIFKQYGTIVDIKVIFQTYCFVYKLFFFTTNCFVLSV